ncbi:MAG: polyprenyl diphosphate synthase [Candidatus Omnitrophica bacterium]|nr:polyprenyl diphosphate synthase [Candidatus Omnitrophota bacterium]
MIHVGIIMDGNGRWAKKHGRPRIFGHKAGADRIDEIVRVCPDIGVKYLSLYAFSTENWNRPGKEVNFLVKLFAEKIKNKTAGMKKEGVRILFLGERTAFPKTLQNLMAHCESETASCRKVNVMLCLNYGSRDEIVRATRKISEDVLAGKLKPSQITEDLFSRYLDTRELPPPDLIIRTSGELRLSNFLLFQAAYAELHFTQTLWPDFSVPEFTSALAAFKERKRRFGEI